MFITKEKLSNIEFKISELYDKVRALEEELECNKSTYKWFGIDWYASYPGFFTKPYSSEKKLTIADKIAVLEEKLGGKVQRVTTDRIEFVPNEKPKKSKKTKK